MQTPPAAAHECWSTQLHAHGLRATEGRVAALRYIDEHPHSSAAAIRAALAEQQPSLSPQSVHNIVNDLTEGGLLRRIDPPDSGSALYETRLHDNHHHVQCVVCHRIEDVDCAVGAAPCLVPSQTHGMRILEATITFRGICPACERAEQRDGADPVAAAAGSGSGPAA